MCSLCTLFTTLLEVSHVLLSGHFILAPIVWEGIKSKLTFKRERKFSYKKNSRSFKTEIKSLYMPCTFMTAKRGFALAIEIQGKDFVYLIAFCCSL